MFNFDYIKEEGIKRRKSNWPGIPYHPYRTLIVGDSGSGKKMFISKKIHMKININY